MVDQAHRQAGTEAAVVSMLCSFKEAEENMNTMSEMKDILRHNAISINKKYDHWNEKYTELGSAGNPYNFSGLTTGHYGDKPHWENCPSPTRLGHIRF